MSAVNLLLDASVQNAGDTVIIPNRTTVNLRPGSGIAMTKQPGNDDVIVSGTVAPTTPGVIGGHVIYTTNNTLKVPLFTIIPFPFDVIETTYGTPVVELGPGPGEVTILSTGTYQIGVRMSYAYPASKYTFLILDKAGVGGILGTTLYTPSTANLQTLANMNGVFQLAAGDVLKVTVEGFTSGPVANYFSFSSADTRWDITRIL